MYMYSISYVQNDFITGTIGQIFVKNTSGIIGVFKIVWSIFCVVYTCTCTVHVILSGLSIAKC